MTRISWTVRPDQALEPYTSSSESRPPAPTMRSGRGRKKSGEHATSLWQEPSSSDRINHPSLCCAMSQIMAQSLEAGRFHIWIAGEIFSRIESGMRRTPFTRANLDVMDQRMKTGTGHIAIVVEIPCGIEKRIGI